MHRPKADVTHLECITLCNCLMISRERKEYQKRSLWLFYKSPSFSPWPPTRHKLKGNSPVSCQLDVSRNYSGKKNCRHGRTRLHPHLKNNMQRKNIREQSSCQMKSWHSLTVSSSEQLHDSSSGAPHGIPETCNRKVVYQGIRDRFAITRLLRNSKSLKASHQLPSVMLSYHLLQIKI